MSNQMVGTPQSDKLIKLQPLLADLRDHLVQLMELYRSKEELRDLINSAYSQVTDDGYILQFMVIPLEAFVGAYENEDDMVLIADFEAELDRWAKQYALSVLGELRQVDGAPFRDPIAGTRADELMIFVNYIRSALGLAPYSTLIGLAGIVRICNSYVEGIDEGFEECYQNYLARLGQVKNEISLFATLLSEGEAALANAAAGLERTVNKYAANAQAVLENAYEKAKDDPIGFQLSFELGLAFGFLRTSNPYGAGAYATYFAVTEALPQIIRGSIAITNFQTGAAWQPFYGQSSGVPPYLITMPEDLTGSYLRGEIERTLIEFLGLDYETFEAGTQTGDIAGLIKDVLEVITALWRFAKNWRIYVEKVDDFVKGFSDDFAKYSDDVVVRKRTEPSMPYDPNRVPGGQREPITPSMSSEKKRGLMRQHQAADTLSQNGYAVEEHLPSNTKKSPELTVEGNVFDVNAPTSDNVEQVRKGMSRKVREGQTDRIVLNLADTNVNVEDVKAILDRKPIQGLQEVIVITKDGDIVHILP